MKKFIYLFITVVFLSIVNASAQPGNPGNGDDPDASIPLDEGLLTVLISGAAIGVSKLVKRK